MTAAPVHMVACTLLELFPQVVFSLLAGALGWDDPHQLQQGDGGHHDDHILGDTKGFMLLRELFAAEKNSYPIYCK